MNVFNRIDHAAGAATVGEKLCPMELLIFGSPGVGTKLIQCSATMGIDLPLKAIIREDEMGTVWMCYNDPMYLADLHAAAGCDKVVKEVDSVLGTLVQNAVKLRCPQGNSRGSSGLRFNYRGFHC